MINYFDITSTLHTRGADINVKDYLFALMVTLGEDKETAYAIACEQSDFNKHAGTESEIEYLSTKKDDASAMMNQPNIKMLVDLLSEIHRADIQKQALNLTDYKFSGEETVQILNSLLKSRIDDIDSASVKDVVGIIKTLTEQGALDVGDGGFSKHFVQIYPPFDVLCVNCNHEFSIVRGVHGVCPFCGQVYKYSKEEDRFYPQPTKL